MHVIYIFIILCLLIALIISIKKNIDCKKFKTDIQNESISQNFLNNQHKRTENSTDDRIINENHQLKIQLRQKTIELATKAKENGSKNRLLLMLKEKIEESQNNPGKAKIRLNEMQKSLEDYFKKEDNIFEIQIDDLHQIFFKKLRTMFPGLSIYDLRLCAYLKIGLSTKEIADLLNVQPSSTYISRSRLRRKLNLRVDEDLHSFLNNI